MTVPADTVRGVAVSTPVDLFVRPEQLRLCEPGDPCASAGTVVAAVYQGAHIDLYIECVNSLMAACLHGWPHRRVQNGPSVYRSAFRSALTKLSHLQPRKHLLFSYVENKEYRARCVEQSM